MVSTAYPLFEFLLFVSFWTSLWPDLRFTQRLCAGLWSSRMLLVRVLKKRTSQALQIEELRSFESSGSVTRHMAGSVTRPAATRLNTKSKYLSFHSRPNSERACIVFRRLTGFVHEHHVSDGIWSIGEMKLTGDTEVLGEKHYTAWVEDEWMCMKHCWNDTDRGNWSTGRKILYSVGERWMNEYGALVEWYWQGETEVLGKKTWRTTGLVSNSGLRSGRLANTKDKH